MRKQLHKTSSVVMRVMALASLCLCGCGGIPTNNDLGDAHPLRIPHTPVEVHHPEQVPKEFIAGVVGGYQKLGQGLKDLVSKGAVMISIAPSVATTGWGNGKLTPSPEDPRVVENQLGGFYIHWLNLIVMPAYHQSLDNPSLTQNYPNHYLLQTGQWIPSVDPGPSIVHEICHNIDFQWGDNNGGLFSSLPEFVCAHSLDVAAQGGQNEMMKVGDGRYADSEGSGAAETFAEACMYATTGTYYERSYGRPLDGMQNRFTRVFRLVAGAITAYNRQFELTRDSDPEALEKALRDAVRPNSTHKAGVRHHRPS